MPKYYTIQVNEDSGCVKVYSNSKHAKGRELSQFLNPYGYLRVKMNNKSYEIHRIVSRFYLGDLPKGLCVVVVGRRYTNTNFWTTIEFAWSAFDADKRPKHY